MKVTALRHHSQEIPLGASLMVLRECDAFEFVWLTTVGVDRLNLLAAMQYKRRAGPKLQTRPTFYFFTFTYTYRSGS